MQYATIADMQQLGLPPAALANVPNATIDAFLTKASASVDSYLRSQYKLPLVTPYPDEIVWATVCIGSYRLMVWRGYNPDEHDAEIRARYEDCVAWLGQLSRGQVRLDAAADATTRNEGAPMVVSRGFPRINGTVEDGELRGW